MLYRFPRTGDLKPGMTIIDPQGTQDARGGYSDTGTTAVWSGVYYAMEWLAAEEQVTNGQVQDRASCRVWIRWRAGMLARYRLTYVSGPTTHTLRIVGKPQEFYKAGWILLDCLEV